MLRPAPPARPWLPFGLVLCAAMFAAGAASAQPADDGPHAVTGALVDERGAPAADVEVVLRPYPSRVEVDLELLGMVLDREARPDVLPDAVDRTRSGADGTYTLSAPRAGPYLIEFRPPTPEGEPPAPSPLVYGSLLPLQGSRTVETVELPDRHLVAVRVLDANGQPVAGALVVAAPTVRVSPRYRNALARMVRETEAGTWSGPQEQSVVPTFHRAAARADDDGIARFSMPTKDARVIVSAPGFVRGEGRSTSGRLSFRLERGPGVRLRVVDRGGAPAPGVLVRAPDTSDRNRNPGGGGLLRAIGFLPALESPGAIGAPGAPLAVTDANGEAVVSRAADGDTAGELAGILELERPDHAFGQVSLPAQATEPPADTERQERIVTARLEAPRRIPGRVVATGSGLPIGGAAVWIREDPGHRATSGPNGAFDLDTRPAAAAIRLRAAAAGYVPERAVIAPSGGLHAEETVIGLTPLAPIRGVVTDDAGKPIGGAKIRAEPRGARAASVALPDAPTTSAPDGAFRVEQAIHGHAYRLTVHAVGYAGAILDLPAIEPGVAIDPIRLVLHRGRRVVGAVVDTNGEPVADTDVALLWPLDSSDFRSPLETPATATVTNAQGAFDFPAVAAGEYELRLRHAGYAERPLSRVQVPAGASDFDFGAITLASGGTIHGIVTGADGEPVAGAKVQAGSGYPLNARTATTDADGRFRIGGLSTDFVDVATRADGYPLLVRGGVRADDEEPVLIELTPGGVVSGRVAGAGGAGAARVPVRLMREFDFRTAGGSMHFWDTEDMFPRRLTDAEGRFRFDRLPPGAWSAEAGNAEEAAKAGPFEVAAGGEQEIELVLGIPDRLAVTVTTALGEPIAGAVVRVRVGGDGRGYGRTDGSGRVVVDISPGSAVVTVEHDKWRDEERQVELSPGPNTLRVELHSGAWIAGSVRSRDGAPLALATVEAVTEHSFDTSFHRENAISDPGGAFRITGLEPGRYRVTARSPGYADGGPETAVTVGSEAVEGVDIVLEPEIKIVGAVAGLTPSGLAQVGIRAWNSSNSRARQATPDTDGNFVVEGIGPGTWVVTATKGSYGSSTRHVESAVTVDPGVGEVFVELRFETGLRVSGQVLDAGKPLVGGSLNAESQTTRTDHNGRFVFEGLAPGVHRLSILRADFSGMQYRSIDLQTDMEDLVIELEPATATLSGIVVHAETGQALRLVNLTAADANTIGMLAGGGGNERTDMTNVRRAFSQPDGTFTLELGPNAERLLATRRNYESLQLPLSVAPGEHRDGVVIEMRPAAPSEPQNRQ